MADPSRHPDASEPSAAEAAAQSPADDAIAMPATQEELSQPAEPLAGQREAEADDAGAGPAQQPEAPAAGATSEAPAGELFAMDNNVKTASETVPAGETDATEIFAMDEGGANPDGASEANQGPLAPEDAKTHNSFFRALSFATPLVLLAGMAACFWPPFFFGDLYCPQEVLQWQFIQSLGTSPLLPSAAGACCMPLFPWLAHFISLALAGSPLALPLASFAGACFAMIGLWLLCRLGRFGRYTPLAAGLALLCMPAFLALAQFLGPIACATGLTLTSLGLLARAWMKESDWPGMLLGHLLAVLAGLTGGLLYALLPVLTCALFCLWRCGFRRARKLDAVAGFALFLFGFLGWAVATIIFTDNVTPSAVMSMLAKMPDFKGHWWIPLACWGIGSLPFLFLVICCSWPRILRNSIRDLKASRHESAGAILYIGLMLALGLALFSPHVADCFPAVALTAALAGRALLRLGKAGLRLFFILAGLLLVAIGLAFLAATVPGVQSFVLETAGIPLPRSFLKLASELTVTGIAATLALTVLPIFSAAAILHVAWRSRTAAAPLLTSAAMVALMAQPTGIMLAPAFADMPSLKLKTFSQLTGQEPSMRAPARPAQQPAPAAPAVQPQSQPQPQNGDAVQPAQRPASAYSTAADPAGPRTIAGQPASPAPEVKPAEAAKPATPEAKPAEAAKPATPEAKPVPPATPATKAASEALPAARPDVPAKPATPEAKPAQ
jgi:hypothetical protein